MQLFKLTKNAHRLRNRKTFAEERGYEERLIEGIELKGSDGRQSEAVQKVE